MSAINSCGNKTASSQMKRTWKKVTATACCDEDAEESPCFM
jgi:hypothetical protein